MPPEKLRNLLAGLLEGVRATESILHKVRGKLGRQGGGGQQGRAEQERGRKGAGSGGEEVVPVGLDCPLQERRWAGAARLVSLLWKLPTL